MARRTVETRDGVDLTNLDEPLSDLDAATKRDLVDYLDALSDRLLPAVADRALSVMRVRPGDQPFMQKNLPKYTPDWVPSTTVWAQASHREIRYPLCNDRRTLLWLANQRAVEFHPALFRVDSADQTHLIIDLDPPVGAPFAAVAAVTALVRRALTELELQAVVKTSGAKGVHIFLPLAAGHAVEDVAAAGRALAARTEALDPDIATTAYIVDDRQGKVFVDATRVGGATVAAVYSPRIRPGLPVSFPLDWDEVDQVQPADFTVVTAPALLGSADPWAERMPLPQTLPPHLIAHGHTIPVARVQAMHEGKRRAKAKREAAD